jgi:hypothetical protein
MFCKIWMKGSGFDFGSLAAFPEGIFGVKRVAAEEEEAASLMNLSEQELPKRSDRKPR